MEKASTNSHVGGPRAMTPAASSAHHTTVSYTAERVIGHGSFGVVFLARIVETGEAVAIKKVLQDRRFQCRELQLMRKLRHPNIAALRHCFYSTGERPDELYLNLVMDFYPDTLHRFSGMFSRQREFMPLVYVRVFLFQLLRALAYLHAPRRNIAHRDIKPQNLFLDPATAVLTLGDFGSAKVLTASEASVSYVCSRYYRAPELIFGATTYTTAVDMWSVGCVAAELMLGQPLFPGDGAVGQMIEIIKVLGTPTPDEIRSMNKTYTDFDFPLVRALPWQRVFRSHTPPEAADLVAACLHYDPAQRVTAADALAHPFFDELRSPGTRLPNGAPLPPLFDLSDEERAYLPLALQQRIVPAPSVLHSPSFLGGKVVAASNKV